MTKPDDPIALTAQLTSGDDELAETAALALAATPDSALPLLRKLLTSSTPDHRWWATRTLGEINSPVSTALLIERTRDPDEGVRAAAIHALGGQGGAQAVDTLAALLSDSNSYLARQAGEALRRMDDAALAVLLEALQHGDQQVRIVAARALAHMSQPDAIPALFNALEDESALVNYWADIGLERRGVGQM